MVAAAVWAITLDGARDAALAVIVIGLAVAVVAAWVVRQVLSKVLTLAVAAAVVAVVWSQRTSLDHCADRVAATLTDGGAEGTCTFFGQDVIVTRPG